MSIEDREARRQKALDFLETIKKKVREEWAASSQEEYEENLKDFIVERRKARTKLLSAARAVVLLGQALEVVRGDLVDAEHEDVLSALDVERREFVRASGEFANLQFRFLGLVAVKGELFPKKE